MRVLLFGVAMFGSLFGILILAVLSDIAQGGTVATYAIAVSVIPYCLASAYAQMRRKD